MWLRSHSDVQTRAHQISLYRSPRLHNDEFNFEQRSIELILGHEMSHELLHPIVLHGRIQMNLTHALIDVRCYISLVTNSRLVL